MRPLTSAPRSHLRATLRALLVATAVAGCAPVPMPDDEPLTGQVSSPILQTGVERTIPIDFYVLNSAGYANPTTNADLQSAIDFANSTWASAGVQFYVDRVVRTSNLTYLGRTSDATNRTWATVAADAAAIDPTLTSALFPSTNRAPTSFWLKQLAGKLPRNAIHVFIGDSIGSGNCVSPFPSDTSAQQISRYFPSVTGAWPTDNSHGILCAPTGAVAGRIGALSHELGHYIGGLYHTFDLNLMSASQPNAEGDMLADYYDLLYDFTQLTVTPFATRVAAQAALDAGRATRMDTQTNCTASPTNCDVTCSYGVPLRTYSTSTAPARLAGLTFSPGVAWEAYGANIMSYLIGTSLACTAHFSQSQVTLIKRHLHSALGDRSALGSGTYRSPNTSGSWAGQIDFDGDRRRDLAVFRRATGQCLVRLATGATLPAINLGAVAQTGDEPVAADFDGDGKTDCGLIRRDRAARTSTWRWYSSLTSQIRSAVMEPNSDRDVPLPGLRMSASGGTSLVSYNPHTGTIYYQVTSSFAPYANVYTSWRSVSVSARGEIIAGRFDNDSLTDFAYWTPGGALTSVYLSTTTWQTPTVFGIGSGAQVALRAVDKDGNGINDLAFWAPSTGNWSYVLNPGLATWRTSTAQWGSRDDIPLGGFDVDGDGRSDELVYRPSGDVDGQGRFLASGSTSGYFGVVGGSGTDLPFATPDEDGDGKAEYWIFRGSGQWWIRSPSATGHAWLPGVQWGDFTDSVF